MHFSLIACTSSFISLSLHRCALGLLQTYIVEIPSCQNHGSKSQGFCVSHSLVHDIKWKGGEGGWEKILFHCLQSCTCLYLTFVVAVIGAVCVVSRVCDPTLAWCFHGCFHWGFHWRSPRCSPPPTSVAVYLESATASGESRGAFWSLLAHSQFCCLGRFYRRGVTQLCIVFYSLALLGVHLKFGSSESTK